MFTQLLFSAAAFVVNGRVWSAIRLLTGVGAAQATASIQLNTDGQVERNGIIFSLNQWYQPAPTVGVGSNYWVRATLLSGSVPDGSPLNTWIALNSDRLWSVTTSGTGIIRTISSSLKIEISSDAGGVIIEGTNTINLTATVDNS